MAEVLTDVYDIVFPSPPPLKEIVAISIALRIWRQEINTHRIKNTLDKLKLRTEIISMRGIPSMITSIIEKYVKRVGISIKQWLDDHSYPLLFDITILNDFIDFVMDFDGSIHYVRTAKRFVQCDKIDKCLRFRIACKYCFEDDILQIWPSLSTRNDLGSTYVVEFARPELKYWVFRLKNELYRLPQSASHGQSIEEEIFCRAHEHDRASYSSWSCVEYFWSRFDSDTRLRVIAHQKVRMHQPYRYLLGKINEVELEKFANTKACRVIHNLMIDGANLRRVRSCDESYLKTNDFQDRVPFIFAMWTYIKEHMNGRAFFSLVQKIILEEGRAPSSVPVCCELWNTAPEHLKANAIQQLLREDSLAPAFEWDAYLATRIDSSFLLAVLSDASAEDRYTFWGRHWRKLSNLMLAVDYDKLMRFCFNNDENEIMNFKLNIYV